MNFEKNQRAQNNSQKLYFIGRKEIKRDKKTQKLRSIFLNDMKLKNENEIMRERNLFESFCFENMKKTENVYVFYHTTKKANIMLRCS